MTDRELDDALAKALGWGINSYDPDYFNVDHCGTVISRRDFSPATSVDALRKWVLPEVERRGLTRRFDDVVGRAAQCSHADPEAFDILSCEPSVLAAAALAVMEEDNV